MHCSSMSRSSHLVGSIYLSSSPSRIFDIVLLYLGADFGTGSDVTCRLREKTEKGRKSWRREQGKKCSTIKTWNSNKKMVIEMNVQPLLPSTTPLVIVAEWREKNRPRPDDTGGIIYGEEKVSAFHASYANCHLTGSNFSNTIDSRWWKDLYVKKRKQKKESPIAHWVECLVNHSLCLPRQLPSEPQIPCLSHVPAIISTQQTPEDLVGPHFKALSSTVLKP